jgi:hypothetical protein
MAVHPNSSAFICLGSICVPDQPAPHFCLFETPLSSHFYQEAALPLSLIFYLLCLIYYLLLLHLTTPVIWPRSHSLLTMKVDYDHAMISGHYCKSKH